MKIWKGITDVVEGIEIDVGIPVFQIKFAILHSGTGKEIPTFNLKIKFGMVGHRLGDAKIP